MSIRLILFEPDVAGFTLKPWRSLLTDGVQFAPRLASVVRGWWRLALLSVWLLFVALVAAAQTPQDLRDVEAQQSCLDSLINWKAVAAMLTAGDAATLDDVYQKLWEHSIATDATYALRRYKLKPDALSLNSILACVPRNRLDTWLLGQVSDGADAHAPEGPLKTALDNLPEDYYDALTEAVVKTGRGYKEYLRLAGILEGYPGEQVTASAVTLWKTNRKVFEDALANLDQESRRRTCAMFVVEPEPWLKDKRIQQLCSDQKAAIEEQTGAKN